MARRQKIRLGDVLIAQKLISQEQLKIVLDEQRRSGRKLGKILVENNFVSEEQISEGLARQLDLPTSISSFSICTPTSPAGCRRRSRGAAAPLSSSREKIPIWWGWAIRPISSHTTKLPGS